MLEEIGSVLLEILYISPQEGELPDFLKKVSVLPICRMLLSDTDHLVSYHPALRFPSVFKKMEKFENNNSSSSDVLPQISLCFVNLGHVYLWALGDYAETCLHCSTFAPSLRDLALLRAHKCTGCLVSQYQLWRADFPVEGAALLTFLMRNLIEFLPFF